MPIKQSTEPIDMLSTSITNQACLYDVLIFVILNYSTFVL